MIRSLLKTVGLVCGLLVAAVSAHAARSALWLNQGPDGGRAGLLAVAPSAPDTLYVSVFDVGLSGDALFRSTDGGSTWAAAAAIGPERNINAIVVSPHDPAKLYLAFSSFNDPVNGVLVSIDGGVSWRQANIENFPNSDGITPSVTAIVADPNNPNIAYLSADTAIYQTTDGGANWRRVNQAPLTDEGIGVEELLIDPATGMLYASLFTDATPPLRSSDGGRTWTPLSGLPQGITVSALAIDPKAANALYAMATFFDPERPRSTLYRSADGGFTWTVVSSAIPLIGRQLIVHPSATQTLYASDLVHAYRSDDGGATWHSLGVPTEGTLQMLAIDPSTPAKLYASSERGVLQSTDGGATWALANRGIARNTVYQIVADPNTPGVVYALTNSGSFKSADRGQSWTLLDNGPPLSTSALVVDPSDSDVVYADRFKSEDGGNSWREMDMALTRVGDLAIGRATPSVLYASGPTDAGPAIQRSSDGGRHWDSIGGNGLPSQSVSELEVDPQDAMTLYATVIGQCYFGGCILDGLYKSSDGGDNWRNLGLVCRHSPYRAAVHRLTRAANAVFRR